MDNATRVLAKHNTPDRYEPVRNALPAQLPPITHKDAQRIRDAIIKKFFDPKGYTPQWWVRDVRRVWISRIPTSASNHDKGLGRLVHDFSHALFGRVYPNKLPHNPLHVVYEKEIAEYVAAHIGRLIYTPKPKVKPTSAEKRAKQLAQTDAAIARWESKQRRAKNALRKLVAKRRRLARAGERT